MRNGRSTLPQGYVYFIKFSSERIKIGYTANLPQRLSTLQIGIPHKLELLLLFKGTTQDEREFHKRFHRLRHQREWFKFRDELEEFVKDKLESEDNLAGMFAEPSPNLGWETF